MARTVEEIKREMTDVFIKNETVRQAYEITDSSATFENTFSKVSIESILFYVVAYGMFVLEKIFDTHRKEVNEIIETILPHRPKWYRDKALNFMINESLITDSDRYDTSEMTDEEIENARVVKYAAATEQPENSLLIIKIATGETGNLQPLTDDQELQFKNYINEIRDAGVQFSVVNQVGDEFWTGVDVYYSPLFLEIDIRRNVLAAIRNYITNLPFNGEYSNMALVDALQLVEGVKIVEVRYSRMKSPQLGEEIINAKAIPTAGYFTYEETNIELSLIAHNAIF